MENKKKLCRIQKDKKIAGVCNGFAEYFNIDVTIVRIGWLLFSLLVGCGIIAYIVAIILMPEK